ncbi:MAG: helix-turn-helix domain-containing protein [Zestosphaera sp.]
MNRCGASLDYATIKVAHYGDLLTDFTSRHNVILLLPQLSLIDGYSHIILQIIPSKKDRISKFLDISKSYADVKHAEVFNVPGLPQVILLTKRNYGVLKAIHKVGGVRAGPVVVERGFKHFPVLIPRYSKSRVLKYVEDFSPCDVSAKLLESRTTFGSILPPSLSEYELQVLRIAFEEGYFEWPRRVRLEDLASKMDISKATVAEHLRKALKKVLSTYMSASLLMESR